MKAAQRKASAMVELLGAKLGRVLAIAEPRDTWWRDQESAASNVAFSTPRNAEADTGTGSFAPGAIEVKVSIDVTFEIE